MIESCAICNEKLRLIGETPTFKRYYCSLCDQKQTIHVNDDPIKRAAYELRKHSINTLKTKK